MSEGASDGCPADNSQVHDASDDNNESYELDVNNTNNMLETDIPSSEDQLIDCLLPAG